MLHTINGLPAHVLLIHAIVVLAPLGALFTVLSAVWPKARRRIGVYGPITCLIVLVLTPITTNAGDWLKDQVTKGQDANSSFAEKVEHHADLGETFLWFAIGMFVFAAAVWWIGRTTDRALGAPADVSDAPIGGGGTATAVRTQSKTATVVPVAVQYVVAGLAVVIAIATTVQLLRIGDSGAQAVWGR